MPQSVVESLGIYPGGEPTDPDASDSELFSDAVDHLRSQSPPAHSVEDEEEEGDDDGNGDASRKQRRQFPHRVMSRHPDGVFMESVSDSPTDRAHTPPAPAGVDATAKPCTGEQEEEQRREREGPGTPRQSGVSEDDPGPTGFASSLGYKKMGGDCSSIPGLHAETVGAVAASANVIVRPAPEQQALLSPPVPLSRGNGNDASNMDRGFEDPSEEIRHAQNSPGRVRHRLRKSSTPSLKAKCRKLGGGPKIQEERATIDDGDLMPTGLRKLPMSIRSLPPEQTEKDASVDSPSSCTLPPFVQKMEEGPATSTLRSCLKVLTKHLSRVSESHRNHRSLDILEIAARKGIQFCNPRWHRPGGYLYSAKANI